METVHFLDLQDRAVRGPIERGLIYYYCHPKVGDYKADWIPMDEYDFWKPPSAQAYPILPLTNVIHIARRDTGLPVHSGNPYWDGRVWGFQAKYVQHSSYVHFCHSSDAGLSDITGVAHGNYMLDKNALLREDIIVDLTTITLEK